MTIEINEVKSGYNLSVINQNFKSLQDYINDSLLHRAGNVAGEAMMQRDFDMNGYTILNADLEGSSITNDRAIRVPVSEGTIPALGPANTRKGMLLSFDVNNGYPITVVPSSGSAADVLNQLAINSDVTKGDALIGVRQPYTGAVGTTQHLFNKRTVNVDDFGAAGDDVTIDDTAFQLAVDSGAKVIKLTQGKTYRLKNGFGITANGITISGYGASIHYVKPDFTYYHCIRIGNGIATTSNTVLEGFSLYCDGSYVRDDTGFGISINKAYNTKIVDVNISAIASAGIWATDSDIIYIHRNTVSDNDADGIHISDGCTNFFITNNFVRNCNDDAIAVVSDTPADGRFPLGGVVANNVVSDNRDGHAYVSIGCANVIWDGNVARGCRGPGFGSYFWRLTAAPTDEDWVRNCKFTNNLVEGCGTNPVNASNGTSFFIGALKDCVVEGNTIQGSPGFISQGTQPNCMLISNALNVQIERNTFHNSNKYGVYTRDANTSFAAAFSGIHIINNTFNLISDAAVWITPNADIGAISIVNNTLINSPFDSGATAATYVHRTGANALIISGNKNLNNSKTFTFNTTNCTNFSVYSNTPATRIAYTPVLGGQGGTPTGTATGFYWQEGGTVFFDVSLAITATNSASNPTFSLPIPAISTASIEATGRENTNTGKMLNGIADSVSVVRMVNYDNTGSVSGMTTTNVGARGRYVRA